MLSTIIIELCYVIDFNEHPYQRCQNVKKECVLELMKTWISDREYPISRLEL